MISNYDRKILTEVGRKYLLNITLDSNFLKEELSFKEHVKLCEQVKNLTYEEVISLTITEDIRAFEGKFGKFLKYSLAAIAGMKFGATLAGPPLAMFALYLYRKVTDTCERSCFKKLPLSKERKICKYECQLSAAKRITQELRSEVSKCSQFTYSEKCEKKLQKEYIKWSKRVQLLIVKINQAKASQFEKQRKANQKQLNKKARSLRAGIELSTDQITKFISENENLRKQISFKQHLKLHQISQYIREDEKKDSMIKIDPAKEKMIRQVMYLGLWIIPVPFFNDLINYMVKKYSFGCVGKCTAQNKLPKDVCYNQCAYLGAKYAVKTLMSQKSKCSKSKNPGKCEQKIFKMLQDWKQREVERKIKFESSLRGAVAKAKRANIKQKMKQQGQ